MTSKMTVGLLLVLMLFSAVVAASKETGPKATYIVGPFDSAMESLPPGFAGHDIVAVYNELTRKIPPKTEFESMEHYGEKVLPLVQPLVFAFRADMSVSIGAAKNVFISYDAEKEEFVVELHQEVAFFPKSPMFTIAMKKKTSKSYVGRNAFGVQGRFTEFTGTCYDIHIFNCMNGLFRSHVKFKLPPDEAKKQKPHVATLFVVKPVVHPKMGCVTYKDTRYQGARIDSSYAWDYQTRVITVTVPEIWIYNIKTGQILHKEVFDLQCMYK
jgi:hypothetical protein